MDSDIVVAIIAGLPGAIMGGVSLWSARVTQNKTLAETEKTKAETESIHAQVADRWAEHVAELQSTVTRLEKQHAEMLLDVSQVRRENESYRKELAERDLIIADLKDWAERLIKQLAQHAPNVMPEPYRREVIGEETIRRLRSQARSEHG